MSLRSRRRNVLRFSLLALVAGGAACGARSALEYGPPLPPPPECFVDEDCPTFGDLCNPVTCEPTPASDGGVELPARIGGGHCVLGTPVNCDDNDPCTNDECNPDTGLCHYAQATLDLDGDGHRAPLPGHKPGDPGSCGDDCDDTNANAYPGAKEVCDGVDNDCNGIVDDNATYVPLDNDAKRIDGDLAPAGPGGLAWSGKSYLAAYFGTHNGFDVYEQLLTPGADTITPPGEAQVTLDNADGDGGPVVWIGDRYGLAWQDRRDGDYEVYFTLLDENGAKVHPDTRLTFELGFSINVTLGWNGLEFITVWQDDRDGIFNLYGQRINVDGAPIGDNIQMTANDPSGFNSESPTVAIGKLGVGVSWSLGDALQHVVMFQVFAPDLNQPTSAPVQLTDGTTDAVFPTVTFSNDRYVIAWYDNTAFPKAIYAAVVGEDGTLLVPPTPVTDPGSAHSRYPYLRPLGDRVLVVYSDNRDSNEGYEIYSRMISSALQPIGPEQRITTAKRDSLFPIAAFGPDGNVGILFRDDRDEAQHVFFTRLKCVAGTLPP